MTFWKRRLKGICDERFKQAQAEGASDREEGRGGDTHHVGQGYSLLGNDQSDIKGGFDGWFVPAGESSAGIGGLVWGDKTLLRLLHLPSLQ